MATNYDFTLDRARKTQDAQNSIQAKWIWADKTLAQWDATIQALQTLKEAAAQAVAENLAKRGALDTALDQLDAWTGEGLTLMRLRLRNDPATLATLSTLTANGTSRSIKLQEALDWQQAWQQIDPTFVPTKDNTLAAHTALRQQCIKLAGQYADTEIGVTTANTALTTAIATLEDDNQAWYKAATKVCKKATPEGALIRSSIPTTTTTPATKPTPPPSSLSLPK